MHLSRRTIALASAGLLAAAATPAWAQAAKYPARAVRMIVPSTPGGGPDAVGRLVAEMLTQRWGQSVVIDNVAGASGQVGANAVVRAPADGQTVLFSPPTAITIAENFEPKPPYTAQRDLVPAALLGKNPAVIVVNSALGVSTMQEFIALAKKEPGKINYGSPGQGNAFHLITELVCHEAGIQLTHIPYRGSGPAVIGLLSNDVQFLVQSGESVREHVRSGKLRALATLESRRIDGFPGTPTLAETGLKNLGIMNWYGVFLPAATPKDVVAFWEKELAALAKDPAFEKRMRDMVFDPVYLPGAEFTKAMEAERQQWRDVIRIARIDTRKQ